VRPALHYDRVDIQLGCDQAVDSGSGRMGCVIGLKRRYSLSLPGLVGSTRTFDTTPARWVKPSRGCSAAVQVIDGKEDGDRGSAMPARYVVRSGNTRHAVGVTLGVVTRGLSEKPSASGRLDAVEGAVTVSPKLGARIRRISTRAFQAGGRLRNSHSRNDEPSR